MSIEEQFGLSEEGTPLEVVNESLETGEEQEADAEGEADFEAEDAFGGEDAGADDDSVEDDEVAEKPKRSKMIPRDRFDEVNERLKAIESQYQQTQWQLDQERLANQKLLGLSKEPEIEEDEVLDTTLEKAVNGKLSALEAKMVDSAIETELSIVRSQAPELLDAHYHLISSLVNQSAVKAKAAGYTVTPEQLYEYAQGQINEELRVIKARGGSAAEFIYQAAQANGFTPKTAGKKQESVVNMKEVKRLREEAGAPAIQRQALKVGAGDAIKAKIRADNKEKGIDETRSAMFGL